MSSQFTRTPRRISPPINSLCESLVPGRRPAVVYPLVVPDSVHNECVANVDQQVSAHGGEACHGWRIWEWPTVLVEAESHVVWRDTTGELREVSPLPDGESSVMFLVDPGRVCEGRQVDNVRRAIRNDPDVHSLIQLAEKEFELMNRGARADQHGEITLVGAELNGLLEIQRRKATLLSRLSQPAPAPGRNDLCRCGSGKKYKRCCID